MPPSPRDEPIEALDARSAPEPEGDAAAPHRVLLLVEYDGTDFSGWQQQADARTVQGELTPLVARMAGHALTLRASSRTDAGVHALGLPVLFETRRDIPDRGWLLGLNAQLPRDISVRHARRVCATFDPRRSARGKTYRYQIWNQPARRALLERYAWHLPRALDLDAMRAAAQWLLGEHDFSAFRAAHCDSRSVHRELRAVEIRRDAEGLVQIDLTANAFMRNMARILVGTLVEVGAGRMDPDAVSAVLSARDRSRAGQTAPAHGLFLQEVRYP